MPGNTRYDKYKKRVQHQKHSKRKAIGEWSESEEEEEINGKAKTHLSQRQLMKELKSKPKKAKDVVMKTLRNNPNKNKFAMAAAALKKTAATTKAPEVLKPSEELNTFGVEKTLAADQKTSITELSSEENPNTLESS